MVNDCVCSYELSFSLNEAEVVLQFQILWLGVSHSGFGALRSRAAGRIVMAPMAVVFEILEPRSPPPQNDDDVKHQGTALGALVE